MPILISLNRMQKRAFRAGRKRPGGGRDEERTGSSSPWSGGVTLIRGSAGVEKEESIEGQGVQVWQG